MAVAATLAWALWEAGLDFWALHARVFSFACLLLLVLLVQPGLRRQAALAPRSGLHAELAGLLGIGLAATVWGMFLPHGIHDATVASGRAPVAQGAPPHDGSNYGNGPGGDRFGALDQINRGNVDKLEVAWTYRTGDVPQSDGNGAEDQLTPLQIGPRSTSARHTTT